MYLNNFFESLFVNRQYLPKSMKLKDVLYMDILTICIILLNNFRNETHLIYLQIKTIKI